MSAAQMIYDVYNVCVAADAIKYVLTARCCATHDLATGGQYHGGSRGNAGQPKNRYQAQRPVV